MRVLDRRPSEDKGQSLSTKENATAVGSSGSLDNHCGSGETCFVLLLFTVTSF